MLASRRTRGQKYSRILEWRLYGSIDSTAWELSALDVVDVNARMGYDVDGAL